MAFDFKEWDYRIFRDLEHRRSEFDPYWERNERYVRNSGNKSLRGNLVREFEKVIYHRVVNKDPTIKVRSADTDFVKSAQDLEIVANDISRIVKLKDSLRQATLFATYSMGWLEVGHPYAGFGLNPDQYAGIPKNVVDPSSFQSQWVEVEPTTAEAQGIDLDNVNPFLDFENQSITGVDKDPSPVFNDGGIGFPYVESVDGKHMVTPKDISNFSSGDYVARLRVLTRDEVSLLTEVKIGDRYSVPTKYRSLFPGIDFNFLGEEAVLVVELWVKKNRLNSDYNNWFAAWVLSEPDIVLRDQPNPWGGMIPYIPVKVTKMGRFVDKTIVDDIVPLAEMHSVALQSIDQDMIESFNPKVVADQTANIKDDDVKKLLNPSYRGLIKVNRAEGIKIERGPGIDVNKIQYVRFLREIAQQSTSTSELDKGQAIKKITARQTDALVESSANVLNGMRELVAEAAEETVTKLMFILGMFHGQKRQYKYGNRVVTFDPGSHDFTTSLIYSIDVQDMGPDPTSSEKMMMIQFIRTVSMNEMLVQQYDWTVVAKQIARLFNWPTDTVIQKPPVEPGLPQGIDNLNPNGLPSQVLPNPGRGPGDQSQSAGTPSLANALSGMARTT